MDSPKTDEKKKEDRKKKKLYELHKHSKVTLPGGGSFKEAVKLPERENYNEWLAVNTVDFFNQLNLLYGSITEFCTTRTCEVMSAGSKYEYLWADGESIKKPIKVSAPEYVDYLLSWVQGILDDESIFPSRADQAFAANFKEIVSKICKRLFRVYAHIYYSHFAKIMSLGEEAHLNTCFKHFYYFVTEFDLVPQNEMNPLQELIDNLTNEEENPPPNEDKKE